MTSSPIRLRRAMLALSAVTAAALLTACSGDATDDAARMQEALQTVRKSLESDLGATVPSLNVLIVTPQRSVFAQAAAPGATPMTADTTFRFASNTKMLTATAILDMHQKGWLDLGATLPSTVPGTTIPYVPDTPEWNIPFKARITLEQLLQHSAGVYDVDNMPVPGFGGRSYTAGTLESDPAFQFDVTGMAAQLTRHGLYLLAPGIEHRYSNTGYAILGEIVARVYTARSGQPKGLADYLADHVTGYRGPDAPMAAVPVPVRLRFPDRATDTELPSPSIAGTVLSERGLQVYRQVNPSGLVAEGNGYGTMRELATFVRTLMQGRNVLRPDTVARMKTSLAPGGAAYALGTMVLPILGHGHTGARVGNLSLAIHDDVTDSTIIAYMPFWDERNGRDSVIRSVDALFEAAFAARETLGLPGLP